MFGFLVEDSHAARAPNAVECSITIEGSPSREMATLFGLDAKHPALELTLSENTAWAVYLLKHDTTTPLANSDGQPKRRNSLRFRDGRPPSLSVETFFQDLGTALPYSKPGYFSFTSENVEESLSGGTVTSKLLKKWKGMDGWKVSPQKSSGDEVFRRSFLGNDGTEVSVQVFTVLTYPKGVPAWEYYISFMFRPGNKNACN